MNVIIRKANIEDTKSVQELYFRLFELEYNNFDATINVEWPISGAGEKYFKELINEGTVWVAVDNGKVIGYLAGRIIGKPDYIIRARAELENIYIDAGYRKRGIGKGLVHEFRNYCINNGIEEIKVTASSKNMNAREFYKFNGFGDFEVSYKMKLEYM